MNSVSVSVLIPTYNYARFLSKALESVLAQTVAPYEIWVADDGSTDETEIVVARYGNSVQYRKFEHQGVYTVRQAMLSEMKGEWFLNLDADNWIEPDFLERMITAIQTARTDEKFAFAYPDIELFGDIERHVNRSEYDVQELKRANFLDMNSLVRLSVARRYGFDPDFNSGQGDYDFFLTLAKNGFYGVRVAEAVLHYRVHEASITRSVGRRRHQVSIITRILQKHRDFFNAEEAKVALNGARNRLMVSIIGSRSPFAGAGKRFRDWFAFAGVGWRHAEFKKQTFYCLAPRSFFRSQEEAADVFFLFRDTPGRRRSVKQVIAGENRTFEIGQLFGFTELFDEGIVIDCNVRLPRTDGLRETLSGLRERRYVDKVGIGLGDVCSARAHLWQMNRARVVVATTDNTGLPAARLKASGKLTRPLVYISIGLPERIKTFEANTRTLAGKYRKLLSSVDRFIAYGHAESEWLRQWLGEGADVRFLPFGVDTERWVPRDVGFVGFDVVSIGADFMRDFELLIRYANSRPDLNICVVTRHGYLTNLEGLPKNVKVKYDMEVDELKKLISAAKVIALPVKENSYSGATTTLLQCMAMEKPVAVSKVGAIRGGYGFLDGENLRWLTPGSLESMTAVLDELLANLSLSKTIGIKARRHVVKNLNWDQFVDNLRKCLKEWL